MEPKVKTLNTRYIVKINGEITDIKSSLKEARALIKVMPINDSVVSVQIVKRTETETLLDSYEPKSTKVLVASQLDSDITL